MNFHLVAFELVQLLPYRRLRRNKRMHELRCVPSHIAAAAQALELNNNKVFCCLGADYVILIALHDEGTGTLMMSTRTANSFL